MAFTASGSLNGAGVGLLRKVRKEVPEFAGGSRPEGRCPNSAAFGVRGTPYDGAFAPTSMSIGRPMAADSPGRLAIGAHGTPYESTVRPMAAAGQLQVIEQR